MNLSDRLTCPFDAPHEIVERPLGDLELHMGLKHDAQHIALAPSHWPYHASPDEPFPEHRLVLPH